MPAWLIRFLTQGCPESSRRLVLVWAAAITGLVTFGIGWAITYRVADTGDVGSGAVAALVLSTGTLCTLAGVAHRKPDTPVTDPTTPTA